MKVYRVEVWRDGRRWNSSCRVEEHVSGTGLLGIGNGHGMGTDPQDAAGDAMVAAELSLHPNVDHNSGLEHLDTAGS